MSDFTRLGVLGLVFLTTVMVLVSGCATAPVPGALYSNVVLPQSATANQAGIRVGESCAKSILGLYAWGDAGIETARRNGGINLITSVDQVNSNFAFLFFRTCTVVRGR